MNKRFRPIRQRGFTFVEVIVAIVVIGVGLAGVLLAYQQVVVRSGDPIVNRQLLAIGEEMLEEIASRQFQAIANDAVSGCARDKFNDIDDYNGYATSGQICSPDGSAISSLNGYSISVSVSADSLGGVSGAKKIVVNVSRGAESIQLVSWRMNLA